MGRKNNWYRATEALLYSYKSFPVRIMALMQQMDVVKEQLIPSVVPSYELREGTYYNISSPVESAVIERIEGDAIQKIERKIKNLETMKEIVEISVDIMLDDFERRIVDVTYNKEQPWQEACRTLGIEKSAYYERRRKIVQELAWCFGYLDEPLWIKPE